MRQIPQCALKGFRRIHLKAGEAQQVTFRLTPEELALTQADGNLIEEAGNIEIHIGGGQPRYTDGKFTTLNITGEPYQVF